MPEQAKKGEVEEKRLSLASSRHPDNVSVKRPAGTRSAHREMVRCCKALSNPPPSCYNLHKVKIHVRRLRSGNGGSSSCAGNPQPQLESPGPAGSAGGTPNRRARFRYCVVFSALQEWCLKGETREGGWEAFWAGGETAICRAFVWPNYYKAPYALNCQRRACCYMTRGMKRVSFLSPVLHHGENRKISQGLL